MTRTSRIVVLETVYHQRVGAEPTSIEARWAREGLPDEIPHVRRMDVGGESVPVDRGCHKKVSVLVVSSEKPTISVRPTPEEQAEMDSRIVEVLFNGVAAMELRPGESVRFSPTPAIEVSVRCRIGLAKVWTHAFPG
jgi:hypothetical protein